MVSQIQLGLIAIHIPRAYWRHGGYCVWHSYCAFCHSCCSAYLVSFFKAKYTWWQVKSIVWPFWLTLKRKTSEFCQAKWAMFLRFLEICFTTQHILNFVNVPHALEKTNVCCAVWRFRVLYMWIKSTWRIINTLQNLCLLDLSVFKEGVLRSSIMIANISIFPLFLLVCFFFFHFLRLCY